MHRLIAIALAIAFAGSFSSAYAQVEVDVGGGAYGSVGESDAQVDADASVDVSHDHEEDSASDGTANDSSETDISLSINQDDAASASLDAESAELGSASVSTSEDLSLYATSKMKRDANIESVEASGDRVSLEYRKEARFLGFIPGSIRATAEVRSDGTVDIDYPWYRFLFAVEGSGDAEAELSARVKEVMADGNGTLTARLEAELIDVMHATLAGQAVASAATGTTADEAGPDVSTDASGSASTSADVSAQ